MGRASSSKKVARAAKAAGRPGTTKSYAWPLGIGLVVLLGIGLIVASAAGRDTDGTAAPILGDHWHAAYGFNVCGEWLPPLSDAVPDESGIHTHEDGLIHIHPFSTRYTGDRATLDAWGETVGVDLAEGSLTLPDDRELTDGDDCGGEPGVLTVTTWDGPADTEGREIPGDPGEYALVDGEVITISFQPEGAAVEQPPTAPRLQDPNAAEEGRPVVPIGDVPPPSPDETTSTTSAAEDGAAADPPADGAEDGATTTTAAP
jgi:hypothetical protein